MIPKLLFESSSYDQQMRSECPGALRKRPREQIGSKVSRLGTLLFSDAWCRMESAGRHGGAQTKHSGAKMLLQVGKSGLRECAREGIHFKCNGKPSHVVYFSTFL